MHGIAPDEHRLWHRGRPGIVLRRICDKRRGAGCDCCDFAVRVNDFLTVGRSPIVGKCFSAEGLLTTTQVVGNKASVSVEQ